MERRSVNDPTPLRLRAFFLLIPCLFPIQAFGAGPGEFPLLQPGQQLSVLPHGYFEEPAPGSQEILDTALADAVGRGLFSVSYELDWSEVEPEKELYDTAGFEQRLLNWEAQGITQFYLNISAISIGSLGAPEDLLDPDDPNQFANGMHVDDPIIVDRYRRMLDAILPVFLEHGGFAFCAGNEVNDYLRDNPEEADHFVHFLEAVRNHVRSIEANLPVGVILTADVVLEDQPWHRPILDVSDFAGYNYYGIDSWLFSPLDEATIRSQIGQLLAATRGMKVLVQETGLPASDLLGATEADQAALGAVILDEFFRHGSQVRWISWFKMTDFSQAFADAWGELFLDEGQPAWWVDRFKAWLRGTGLRVYDTGQARIVWDEFLAAVDRTVLSAHGFRWVDETSFSWEAIERADRYDIVRGSVSAMQSFGDLGDASAYSCSVTGNTASDTSTPNSGDAFYYLVRSRAGSTTGPWGYVEARETVAACD